MKTVQYVFLIWMLIHTILLANSMNYDDGDCRRKIVWLSPKDKDNPDCKFFEKYDLTDFLLLGATPFILSLIVPMLNPKINEKDPPNNTNHTTGI